MNFICRVNQFSSVLFHSHFELPKTQYTTFIVCFQLLWMNQMQSSEEIQFDWMSFRFFLSAKHQSTESFIGSTKCLVPYKYTNKANVWDDRHCNSMIQISWNFIDLFASYRSLITTEMLWRMWTGIGKNMFLFHAIYRLFYAALP